MSRLMNLIQYSLVWPTSFGELVSIKFCRICQQEIKKRVYKRSYKMLWLFDSVQDGAEEFAVGWYGTDVVYSLSSVSSTYD